MGICQLVQHPALDAATEGFEAALKDKLGDNVKFDLQNASGDSATCATIINQFVSNDVDLILANATAALQAAAAGTSEIPILGTSITDYATALDIDNWTGTTGLNISGTSDLAPLDQQAAMLNELFPDAKNVGLLYCSAEPNSKYQATTVKGYLEDLGYTCKEYTFADSNDIASVTTTAAGENDVLYVPTDNTAASNADKAREGLETKKQQVDDAVAASKTATEAAKKATTDTLASKKTIEQNEETRKTAEQMRATSEAARVKAEQGRVDVESKRVAAESSRSSAEQKRASAETARASAENSRVKVENDRKAAEKSRSDAEVQRVVAEHGRVGAEQRRESAEHLRETNTSTAIESSKTQTDLAKELNEHPPKMGDNGNWWQWNLQTHAYEDTGIIARGGAM